MASLPDSAGSEVLSPSFGPLTQAMLAGLGFVTVAQALLVLQALAGSAELGWLSTANLLALLTGAITAAGLWGVIKQIQAADQAAKERLVTQRREDSLRLDAFHAHFGSPETRAYRNLAFAYLMFLSAEKKRLEDYAAYWVKGGAHEVVIPTVDDLRAVFKPEGGGESGNAYDRWACEEFVNYDMAVSAMTSFFSRVSIETQHMLRSGVSKDEILKAIGPFFWSNYWGKALMPLVEACAAAASTPKDMPYFIDELRLLAILNAEDQ